MDSNSDISTNPSIIQGSMAGPQIDDSHHWSYELSLLQHSRGSGAHESIEATAAGSHTAAAVTSQASQGQSAQEQSVIPYMSTEDVYQPQAEEEHETAASGNGEEPYMGVQITSPTSLNLAKDEGLHDWFSAAQPG